VIKNLLAFFFVIAACYLAGVRVHPANAAKLFEKSSKKNDGYVLLELARGKRIAGRLVNQTPEAVRIQIGGGTTTFQKSEINSMRVLSTAEVGSGLYDALIIREKVEPRPLVTMRYEDSVLARLEKKARQGANGLAALIREKTASFNPAQQLQQAVMQAPAEPASPMANLPAGLPEALQKMGSASDMQNLLGHAGQPAGEADYSSLTQALSELKKSSK